MMSAAAAVAVEAKGILAWRGEWLRVSLSRYRVSEIRGNRIRGSRFSRVESLFLVGKDYPKPNELHVPVFRCAFP